jgi:vacuolar protein sorting-associated protein VTA1
MAATVPAKLKTADLTRFIVRAAQLESAKPVIAYWCGLLMTARVNGLLIHLAGEYWIANQIIAKDLHNGDDETLKYTMNLMDKLETVRVLT